MNSQKRICWLIVALSAIATTPAFAYKKATEGKEVVLNKLYPRENKFQLDGKAGMVLNTSYTQTFLIGAGANYFFNETWGVGADINMAINSDKNERECIENFYNDPDNQIAAECGKEGSDAATGDFGDVIDKDLVNYGPAYAPIRELNMLASVNALWNPVYGKQIVLLSGVGHFDMYVAMGGGIATSTYYPMQKELRISGNTSRGSFPESGTGEATPGTMDPDEVGISGRPDPISETHVMAHAAVGQRFHFAKRFSLLAELNNYTLIGTDQGFDNFFALMGGFAMRF